MHERNHSMHAENMAALKEASTYKPEPGDMQREPAASIQMPKYRSHKEVWALQIAEKIIVISNGDVILHFDNSRYSPMKVDKAVVSRYMPIPGDYLVVYDDGYKSISPAKAFEDGYTLIA